MDDRGIGVRFPTDVRGFTLFHNVQTGSGDTGGYFHWDKATGK
jgi:hypothetical protein